MNKILDPRTKLFLLIFAAIYISLQVPLKIEVFVMIIYLLPFFLAGRFKTGITFLFIYIFQIISTYLFLPKINASFLLFIFSFLAIGLRTLMPSMLAGVYALQTTRVGEWVAAFKVLRFPDALLIPLTVIARFFPTIRKDYQSIRKAMAFRGIRTRHIDLIKNPIQSFEYILVPLLINATQVAEDLTISALTKGLSLPGKHTSLVQLQMTKYDYIYFILTFLPFILYTGGIR